MPVRRRRCSALLRGLIAAMSAAVAAPVDAQQPQAATTQSGAASDAVAWRKIAHDRSRQPDERQRALSQLQDAGALDVDTVIAVLDGDDEALAGVAAAIVRHEWFELPAALFAALDVRTRAARALLRELAIAPRPAAAAWVAGRTGEAAGRTVDDRLLAMAARNRPLDGDEAQLLLDRLCSEDLPGDGCRALLATQPSIVADRLISKLHGALATDAVTIEQIAPLLDRVSDAGLVQLFGLIVMLPPELGAKLAREVHARAPARLAARIAAALDATAPLNPAWLPFSGPQLDRESRRQRVLQILTDPTTPPAVREHAFGALVDAQCVADPVLDFAASAPERYDRVRLLLDEAIDALPAARLLTWLNTDVELADLVVKQLWRRRELQPELQRELMRHLEEANHGDGEFLRSAALAILHQGDSANVERLWPLALRSTSMPELVDALGRRSEAWVDDLMRAELARPAGEAGHTVPMRDAIALALCSRGDRTVLTQLVLRASTAEPMFVRRCAHHAKHLPPDLALQLLDAVALLAANATDDADVDELRVEMFGWAAGAAADAEVRNRLLQRPPPATVADEEMEELAMRALMHTPHRATLVAELRAALAQGALTEAMSARAYAALATMPTPRGADDLALALELWLLPPLGDPERERELVERWPDGAAGFPMVAAVAQSWRGVAPEALAEALAAMVPKLLADPRHRAISMQRLLVAWRTLVLDGELQTVVGRATAPLAHSDNPLLAGPAHWFAAGAALDSGDAPAAIAAARRAIAALLRSPSQRGNARVFLGERDPGAGIDPHAALAVLPHLAAAHAAIAAGDTTALAHARACIHEFAGRDAESIATLARLPTPETLR